MYYSIYNVYVQCASCNRFFQVLLKYLKCQSETYLSEENNETICTIEDGEIFSLAKPFRSQRQALGPKGLFVKCVDIHASFTSKVKNVHYFFMTVDDRTDISVLWVQ